MEVISHSTAETQRIAATLAQHILAQQAAQTATVIALEGDLGAGKTTFVQGFIHSLGIQDKVKSPTFLLMKRYALEGRDLYHLDCYRITTSQDLVPLEIPDVLSNPRNIVLVEWPERIADILPSHRTVVHLEHISETERKITVTTNQ